MKIEDFWSRDEKTVNGERLKLAVQRLRSQGEQALVASKTQVLDCRSAVESAMTASLKTPDFSSIVNAQLELKAAELELREARSMYEMLFGEAPTIAGE